MRVAIAGAGAVGRSIARELILNGHSGAADRQERRAAMKPDRVPDAEWLLADCLRALLAGGGPPRPVRRGHDRRDRRRQGQPGHLAARQDGVRGTPHRRPGEPPQTTSGSSPRPGASTSTCRRRGSWRRWSRKR
jgi:hypothetical protein